LKDVVYREDGGSRFLQILVTVYDITQCHTQQITIQIFTTMKNFKSHTIFILAAGRAENFISLY
jgi:hypothetical protein